ncbi:MAG: SUF system NifU family Fe-S cluster assembly protein [Trueperella sp.]|nr:SUF system NifU family Fe-S cluster assembly protein [Trueperella sp.]
MSDLDQMYQQIILDAARERHGEGQLPTAQGESFQVNPSCGDEVTMQVELVDGKINLAWTGHGCSISQASISLMSDLVSDKSVAEFDQLYETFHQMMELRGAELDDESADQLEDAAALSGVSQFPMRIKCALLGWMALRDATAQALASATPDNATSTTDIEEDN